MSAWEFQEESVGLFGKCLGGQIEAITIYHKGEVKGPVELAEIICRNILPVFVKNRAFVLGFI